MLKKRIYTSILLLTLISITIKSQISSSETHKFSRVMDLIDMFYVDTVTENKLIEAAIISVLKKLDPHSIYIKKEDVKEINSSLIGSFEGIGITYNILNDTTYIISTTIGSPAEKTGVKAGDRIIFIADEKVVGINLSTGLIKKKLTGEKGSSISIKIKRKYKKELLNFNLTRAKIPLKSIEAAYIINPKIAYIRLGKFAATTMREFEKAAKKLNQKGAKSIILDLRDNGGGYLSTAIKLTDQFFDAKKLIVYTNGINRRKSEYFSNKKGNYTKAKLVVLIDEETASASEILSGAIQDWDRGIIIGRRSFGKGLVQKPFYLEDGSMIRLTIARYYTPSGRLIQKSYKNGNREYKNDISNRIKHGELYNADSISFPDSLKFTTLENKRIVYGGGGIMPDIFVPVDTSFFPKFYKKIMNNGILYEFVLNKIDIDREKIAKLHPTFSNFKKNYIIDKKITTELTNFCVKKESKKINLKKNNNKTNNNNVLELQKQYYNYNFNIENIKNHIKALIARDLWGQQEYYEIINLQDKTIKTAINVLNNKKKYNSILN